MGSVKARTEENEERSKRFINPVKEIYIDNKKLKLLRNRSKKSKHSTVRERET
jgi:hypothetical protein